MKSNNTNPPFISVIMPTYNHARFIGEAIESVLNQTYSNLELIIIDNYSEDNTEQKVKSFADKRIKYFKFSNHGIIAASRNIGIKDSKGKYIAFLDADDKWSNEKLARVNNYIEKDTDVDLICHNEYLVRDGRVISKLIYGPFRNYADLLFRRNCISTSATVVRRIKLFEAGLFSENMDFNGVEDYELWLRLSKICKIEYLHEVLGECTIHSNSITSNIVNHAKNALNVVNFHFKQWDQKTLYYKLLMIKRRARIVAGAVYRSCKAGKLDVLFRLLMTALPKVFKR